MDGLLCPLNEMIGLRQASGETAYSGVPTSFILTINSYQQRSLFSCFARFAKIYSNSYVKRQPRSRKKFRLGVKIMRATKVAKPI